MDPTLAAGIVGATGSIAGALLGTILGYKMSNSKADVEVYVDNRVWLYYYEHCFSMFIPISVINEGSKSFTITNFDLTLISPTNQNWKLYWQDFAEENSHKGEGWSISKTASPFLVHGKSGAQHYIRLTSFTKTSENFSDVILSTGQHQIILNVFDRSNKNFLSKKYYFNVETEPFEVLARRRKDIADLDTWWLPVRSEA
ncbi:hypothetical protein [Stutzerimonas stutzeri]|uniref:hypothetical protein n=1 Tax=Stutzerimonas stutzeri TaxID=316 RepID=UPI0012600FDB|nr:hypothetical protein [Stutzerimonas stutzeri]